MLLGVACETASETYLFVALKRSKVLVALALRPEPGQKPESHRKCVSHGRGEGPRRTGFDCGASILPYELCVPMGSARAPASTTMSRARIVTLV
jgi:hypothetical protein